MLIRQVIELLQTDDWYNVSKEVDIAKGKNQLITKPSELIKQAKRIIKAKY